MKERADRREIRRLLDFLTPAARVQFLSWACTQARGPLGVRVTSHTGTAGETYADLVTLGVLYGVDLDAVAVRLERVVRKGT